MAYAHIRPVTIFSAKVGGTLANYPALINGIYPYLATTANGGDIENTVAVNGITVPADLVFTSEDISGTTVLPFEIESYDEVTGELIAWFLAPTVSASTDTVYYIRYGDAAVVTWQGDIPGTWPANFKGVWHLKRIVSVNPDCTDSTSNGNDGTPTGLGNELIETGVIDGCSGFSGGGDGISVVADTSLQLQSFTVSFWVNSSSIGEFGSNHGLASEITLSGGWAVDSGWAIIQFNDGRLRFEYSAGSAQFSSFTNVIDTWYFFAISFDSATGSLKIYKNGALVDTIAATAGAITYAGDTPCLGGPNTGGLGDNTFTAHHGLLDEIRIYSGLQSAGWILTEYNNEFDPSTFYEIGPESSPFTASCGDPPDGTAGVPYTHTFPTPDDGGVPPFFWALLTRAAASWVPEDVINDITLEPFTAVWSGTPAVPGTYEFTLAVVDTVSFEATVDCSITIADGATPEDHPDWRPGPGWDFNSTCAHTGGLGLRHVADGTDAVANSKTANLNSITVEAGWILYVAFWLKGSGGADGTVGFGFMFFDEDDVYISESYVTSTSSPTSWTQFEGNITVPAGAVRAVPVVQTIDHLAGVWCVDDVYATRGGLHFILSSTKTYFDKYTLYR
jgi:hypothetical protein